MRYLEKRFNGDTFRIQEFDSLGDFTGYLETAKPAKHFARRGKASSQEVDDYDNWHGTRTYGEALDLTQHGWLPAAEKLSKKLPVASTLGTAKAKRNEFNVVGFQASVPRYLQGIPTNMVNQKVIAQKQKIIVLNRSVVFPANWSSERIMSEGIKALQVVQMIESQGFRVKMNVFTCQQRDEEIAVARVCVKKPDERFSLAKIAFPMAHTGFLRRLMFKWVESFQELQNDFTGGYGFAVGERYKDIAEKSEVVLPSEISNVEEYVKNLKL